MNDMPTTMAGIDSLIHAAAHFPPAATRVGTIDLEALRDDVREAIVAIYCDHDEQAVRRVAHARWLLRGQADPSIATTLQLEAAAFYLQRHQPWTALSALRVSSDALLVLQFAQGEPS